MERIRDLGGVYVIAMVKCEMSKCKFITNNNFCVNGGELSKFIILSKYIFNHHGQCESNFCDINKLFSPHFHVPSYRRLKITHQINKIFKSFAKRLPSIRHRRSPDHKRLLKTKTLCFEFSNNKRQIVVCQYSSNRRMKIPRKIDLEFRKSIFDI